MRYMMLIYTAETQDPAAGSGDEAAMMAGYQAFGEEAGRRGAMVDGQRLHPSTAARTVRVTGGKTVATNGPFAETKEQLGGYYILECKTEAEAIELAAMIPGAKNGSVEVRPIWEM